MPHDLVLVADTLGWFRKAEDDLRGAEIDLAADPPLAGDALFHCQQAAEKILRGFLTWKDAPFRKTHDLREIGEQVVKLEPSLASLCNRVEHLTVYAWVFRYPGDTGEPSEEDAIQALSLARELYQAVLRRLPQDVHSS
jgi:HEPN domain-containing protein